MDAKEFIQKANRFCENHDCHGCPLDRGDTCLLDHFEYVHIDHDKLIILDNNLVDTVENWKEEENEN